MWLEPVQAIRIDNVKISSDAEENTLELLVFLHAPSAAWRIEVDVFDGDKVVAQRKKKSPRRRPVFA